MGFFKKLVKGIGKGFKGIGKGIKKIGRTGVGKFLKAGIGIAASFVVPGSGMIGKLLKTKTVLKSTKFAGKVLKSARAFRNVSAPRRGQLKARPSRRSRSPALSPINRAMTVLQSQVFGKKSFIQRTPKKKPIVFRKLPNFTVSGTQARLGTKRVTKRRGRPAVTAVSRKMMAPTVPKQNVAKQLGIAASVVGISVGLISLFR